MEALDDDDDEMMDAMLAFLLGEEQVGVMMADAQGDDDEIFVYTGGDQRVPPFVRRARIHRDVKIVARGAFRNHRHLISVEFHDGVEIIEEEAFYTCRSLRSIKLLGVRIIKEKAFQFCSGLTGVEFGDKLETIERYAFGSCIELKNIKMLSVRTIGEGAFSHSNELSDVEFGEALRAVQGDAFSYCPKLKRVALPLKDNMFRNENDAFYRCSELETVDLVGGIHQTVASLHMECWRNEMMDEINRINQTLPITDSQSRVLQQYVRGWSQSFTPEGKTLEIQLWMESVINRLDHYKDEHHNILKEATTLLDLSLWKTNLAYNNKGGEERGVRTEGEVESSRDKSRYTSGADIVIKNVLPFLVLKL